MEESWPRSWEHTECSEVRVHTTEVKILPWIIKITISSIVIAWFKKLLFFTNSLAELLSDSLLLDVYLIRRFVV